MSQPKYALELLVVAIYGDVFASIDKLEVAFTAVVNRVEQKIQETFRRVRLLPQIMSVSQAFEELDSQCAAVIIEISDFDTKLSFLTGRLHGAGVPCVTISQKDAQTSWRDLTTHSSSHLTYVTLDDFRQAGSSLEQQLLSVIPQSRILEELIYRLWFPRETTSIWIVCPQIHEPGEYADPANPDYSYLDNLGDTSALLELTVFLSQYYPKATIEQFSSDDLPDGHTRSNLVVIGGPGSADISNEISSQMMRLIKSQVAYSDDCEEMSIMRDGANCSQLRAEYCAHKKEKKTYSNAFRRNGFLSKLKSCFVRPQLPKRLTKDWGYFARFRNPLNESTAVVLASGIHTAGVVGAARAFSERRETLHNYQSVYESGVDISQFECFFEVPILNGVPKVPEIVATNILQLGFGAASPDVPPKPPTDRRSTLRILFVGGDRGGSQVNQLQIPKEHSSIQNALRSSLHRDVVLLTQPILAATRESLAHAYRESPTALHFVGHGDDRSLAIIEDQGLIAKSIPLESGHLRRMIKLMKQRVRLCVLNACLSAELAKEIIENEIVDFSIGWPARVGDFEAINFSTAFYGAIGDGRTLQDSFDAGKIACGSKDEPVLFASLGKDPNIILLVDSGDAA